jgi:hypothetical protein
MGAFFADARRRLEGGSTLGEALAGVSRPAEALGFLRDRYRQWTLGRNMETLARFLTDPANQQRLTELAQGSGSAGTRAVIQADLIRQLLEGRNSDMVDAMMNGRRANDGNR